MPSEELMYAIAVGAMLASSRFLGDRLSREVAAGVVLEVVGLVLIIA
ncbi:MAG: hypothetical protein MUD10_02565 [Candidatus Pacebacteria bacterium]|jgi:drug/metabolite transporter (DMT)-like permease|nr:hypothetical protein [Candidatus Paceibacterota bacterium]